LAFFVSFKLIFKFRDKIKKGKAKESLKKAKIGIKNMFYKRSRDD